MMTQLNIKERIERGEHIVLIRINCANDFTLRKNYTPKIIKDQFDLLTKYNIPFECIELPRKINDDELLTYSFGYAICMDETSYNAYQLVR